ncbi:hypothetical protein NDU88_005900 [Pleurodeles waltl]|uniref:Uncharacterized protein n=1 Tax=Pleurodeles waltl TaxID=8319 RepID=A0AAV7UKT8_PLEWA|nr:hypothetical protein NDU88_005900 [Pleurodeles waltl]
MPARAEPLGASWPRCARGLQKSTENGEAAVSQRPRSLRAETRKELRSPKALKKTPSDTGRKKSKKKGEHFPGLRSVFSPLSAFVRAGGRGVVLMRLR